MSEQVGHLTNKRIFRIQFSHNGKQHKLAVGDRFQDLAGEPVIAPDPRELAGLLGRSRRDVGPLELSRCLVDYANSRGGTDNITAAILRRS